MSADAWEICPVCHNLPEEYRGGIDHLYGKISREEFSKLEKEIAELENIATVREDYELGLNDDGTAYIFFAAKCETCGTEWNYNNKSIPHD